MGSQPLLTFLDRFRYPLAGEFAMARDLAWINRIPGDWGLEIGVLAEVHRNCALRRICQVDIADAYEHTHQRCPRTTRKAACPRCAWTSRRRCSATWPARSRPVGEHAQDSAGDLSAGSPEGHQPLPKRRGYHSLKFDRHEERTALEVFLKDIKLATDRLLEDPLGVPMISNWSRVTAAVPDIFGRLIEAVEEDHEWEPGGEPKSRRPGRSAREGS